MLLQHTIAECGVWDNYHMDSTCIVQLIGRLQGLSQTSLFKGVHVHVYAGEQESRAVTGL